MGCSYRSYAVVGVPFASLYEERKQKKHVTKYNEDTGKPYQQEVIEISFFWCGKEIEEECDYMEGFVKKMCGLEVYDAGSGNDGGTVGLCLAKPEPGDVQAIDGLTLSKAFLEVKEKLQKSGYNGNVQLYIISYISC